MDFSRKKPFSFINLCLSYVDLVIQYSCSFNDVAGFKNLVIDRLKCAVSKVAEGCFIYFFAVFLLIFFRLEVSGLLMKNSKKLSQNVFFNVEEI